MDYCYDVSITYLLNVHRILHFSMTLEVYVLFLFSKYILNYESESLKRESLGTSNFPFFFPPLTGRQHSLRQIFSFHPTLVWQIYVPMVHP